MGCHMEWISGFILGILVDAIRSVAAPATTDWIRRFVPSEQRKANIEESRAHLEIRERLAAMGLDPALANHADKSLSRFIAVLDSQKDAFVAVEAENAGGHHQTQLEMNAEAASRAEIAHAQMNRILTQIELARFVTPEQKETLEETQMAWETYAELQARFAAAAYEGGSIMPLVYHSAMEALTITRTAELQLIYDDQKDR